MARSHQPNIPAASSGLFQHQEARFSELMIWLAECGATEAESFQAPGSDLLSGHELAEVLWLAQLLRQRTRQQPETLPPQQADAPLALAEHTQSSPTSSGQNDAIESSPVDKTHEHLVAPEMRAENPLPAQASADLLPAEALPDASDLSAVMPVWLEDPKLIGQPLKLLDCMEELTKPSESYWRLQVDEEQTVERSAQHLLGGLLLSPVMVGLLEPTHKVVLALDGGISMRLWDRLVPELKNMFRSGTAFRDVRPLPLCQPDGILKALKELQISDSKERSLVLVLSDCAGRHWWSGAILPVLQQWSARLPLAVLQVLPRHHWQRTALGLGEEMVLRNGRAGQPADRYQSRLLRRQSRRAIGGAPSTTAASEPGFMVPVISCDGISFRNWSAVVMGDTRRSVAGFRMPCRLKTNDAGDTPQHEPPAEPEPGQQWQRFRELSSPGAVKLAGLLSAAPVLTLPVMRLVKQAWLPGELTPMPMAEVLLSGLLKIIPRQDERLAYADRLLQFHFSPALKTELLKQKTVSCEDTASVVNAVSKLVEQRWNRFASPDQSFRAFLTDPSIQAPAELKGLERFASIVADTIDPLGGEYKKFADRLRLRNISGSKDIPLPGSSRAPSHEDYSVPLPDWLAKILRNVNSEHRPSDADNLLAAAFHFAYQKHEGQFRASGEPYIIHPIAVADLLHEIGASAAVIATGFLHDVVEDTEVTANEIEGHFGAEVRALVEGVTKLGGIHFTNKTEAQAENLRRMFLAMASDIRVVLVKLADRLHNMRTLSDLRPEKQQRIARETREIYAPLANRLGIYRFKWELEDLAFKILEPEAYREVQQLVGTKRSEREERLAVTVQLLRDRLAAVGLTNCEVSGRPKHLYGIWSKMQRQQKAFHEIYDVAALRILCLNLDGCYRALAVVHDTFRPIPGRFKDYIGLPKPNGYQSLHTAVIGRHRPLEVQIRTSEMHYEAEYGIAAPWKYMEGGSPAASGSDAERFNWLRQLVDWQKDGGTEDSRDYLCSIKDDLFDEEVFVFTPKGDVVGLPMGSTAVDFAYRIHSKVGNHCQGVRINDRLSPLSTPLQNGDFVQIITAKTAHPSLDWLNFVATPTARNRIRQWYRRSHRDENILRGREMLERELGCDRFDALLHGEAMAQVARRCKLSSSDDLLAAIGCGDINLQQVLNRVREERRLVDAAAAPALSNEDLAGLTPPFHNSDEGSACPIMGLGKLKYTRGGCCSPLPGQEIVAIVTLVNNAITIHRQDCAKLSQMPVERRLSVCWNPTLQGTPLRYSVQLRIEVLDRVGVLKDILTRMSDHRINVRDVRVRTNPGKPALIDLRLVLLDVNQLVNAMNQIRSLDSVLDVRRRGIE